MTERLLQHYAADITSYWLRDWQYFCQRCFSTVNSKDAVRTAVKLRTNAVAVVAGGSLQQDFETARNLGVTLISKTSPNGDMGLGFTFAARLGIATSVKGQV